MMSLILLFGIMHHNDLMFSIHLLKRHDLKKQIRKKNIPSWLMGAILTVLMVLFTMLVFWH